MEDAAICNGQILPITNSTMIASMKTHTTDYEISPNLELQMPAPLARLDQLLIALSPLQLVLYTKPLEEFEYFLQLPGELQNRIWGFAAFNAPRELQLRPWICDPNSCHGVIPLYKQPDQPGILLACQASRAIALKYYQPLVERAPVLSSESDAESDASSSPNYLRPPTGTRIRHVNFEIDVFCLPGREAAFGASPELGFTFSEEAVEKIQLLHMPLGKKKRWPQSKSDIMAFAYELISLKQLIIVAEFPMHYALDILNDKSTIMRNRKLKHRPTYQGHARELKTHLRAHGFKDTLAEELLMKAGTDQYRKKYCMPTKNGFRCNAKSGLPSDKSIRWKEYREVDLVPMPADFQDLLPRRHDLEHQILRKNANWELSCFRGLGLLGGDNDRIAVEYESTDYNSEEDGNQEELGWKRIVCRYKRKGYTGRPCNCG